MKLTFRAIVWPVAVIIAASVFFLGNQQAKAQMQSPMGSRTRAMSGCQTNPLYDDSGHHGQNPLYEQKLRFLLGGTTSILGSGSSRDASYFVNILIVNEVWDGAKWTLFEKIIHRDLPARGLLMQTIDVISTPEGVDISVNRGPRQSVSLDGDYSHRRISTNLTIERQTPKRDFGDRMSVQSFEGPDGEPGSVVTVPFE